MDYEYVALQYGGEKGTSSENALFEMWYNKLCDEGWSEVVRAPWRLAILQGKGGACIMRRPKDQPRKWTEGELVELMKATWLVEKPPSTWNMESHNTETCCCATCEGESLKEETNG